MSNTKSLASDLLRGAKAIGDFIGEDEREAFYKLEKGYIPATKEGRLWVASKTRLAAFYGGNSKPPVKRVEAEAVAPLPRTLSRRLPSRKSKQKARQPKRKQRWARGDR